MKPEIEVKFCNVSHDEMRAKLKALGATCEVPMRTMRRKSFDFPDMRLDKERNAWVRVRDESNKITMSYKQLNNRELDGTHEVNLTIDNFDLACNFLEQIGMEVKAVQETRRESWMLDNFEIELDEWPWTKPYIEFEGPDEASLKDLAGKLGLDWKDALFGSVEVVYQAEYDVTDKEVDYIPEFAFDLPVPEVLESKRKQLTQTV